MKYIIWTALLSLTLSIPVFGQQYANEPSDDFPYGKAHPEGPEAIKDRDALIVKCQCKSVQRNPVGRTLLI